jgi:hypothetical protein
MKMVRTEKKLANTHSRREAKSSIVLAGVSSGGCFALGFWFVSGISSQIRRLEERGWSGVSRMRHLILFILCLTKAAA